MISIDLELQDVGTVHKLAISVSCKPTKGDLITYEGVDYIVTEVKYVISEYYPPRVYITAKTMEELYDKPKREVEA